MRFRGPLCCGSALTSQSYDPRFSLTGIKNADEAELRQLASEPLDLNVYNVSDFPLLSKVVARLVHILCGRIEERGLSKRKLSILFSSVLN